MFDPISEEKKGIFPSPDKHSRVLNHISFAEVLFVRKFFFLTLEASDSSFKYFESGNMFSVKSPLRALQNC